MATITKKGPKIRSTEKSEEFKLKSIEIFKDVKSKFCVVIKGLKSVNNLPAPSIVPPFDVRSISCSCLYQMIE